VNHKIISFSTLEDSYYPEKIINMPGNCGIFRHLSRKPDYYSSKSAEVIKTKLAQISDFE